MERRLFLAAAGSALVATAGCLGSSPVDDANTNADSDDSDEDGDSTDPDADRDPESETHHLYLVNLDEEARRVTLDVARRDGETALEGAYEIPADRGGEFRAVAAWGETYDVTATLESGLSETFYWEIEDCPGPKSADDESDAAELPGGSRNGSLRIEPGADDLSFVTDICDEIVAGTEASTGPAWQFEVEDAE